MKYSSYLALLILFCSFSIVQKEKDYSKLLEGTVKINEHLYYDETEVSNEDWRNYLDWAKEEFGADDPRYTKLFPDTLVWRSKSGYNEPYVKYYLKHPAYADYPVVGVSWQQATDYCAWRTIQLEEKLKIEGKRDKAPFMFAYRLPSYDDWTLVYNEIKELPNRIGEEGKRKWRGLMRYNMKRSGEDNMGVAGKINDNADITAPVKSYWPGNSGVYNIKGNVSEWLMAEGQHVGGAWSTPMENDISEIQKLEGTSSAVGFRCVCEAIIEAP